MKNLLLLFAIILCTSVFAQKYERVYSLQTGKYNKYLKKWDWDKGQDCDLRFSMDGNFVKVNDEAGTRLWTYEDLGEDVGYDEDGDRYKKHTWRAYDEKNRRCFFMMMWYTNIKLVTYNMIYSDFAFRYYISTEIEL